MGFNSAFKWVKIVKNPGNGRLNNLNDPVLNKLLTRTIYIKLNSLSYILRKPIKQNIIFVEAGIFILFAVFIKDLMIIPSVSKRVVSHW